MESIQYYQGKLLAIETSCDDTCAAILDGNRVLSNIISSQADLHKKWGGVVPEMAAREHLCMLLPVIEEALELSNTTLNSISAIAVTNRPGLVGSLNIGLTAAKSLSLSLNKPFIGVHHHEGHILSTLAQISDEYSPPKFPHICLVASGGHTELVLVHKPGKYEVLGSTLDDAAGEALDKAARLLQLKYPSGKSLQDAACKGNPSRYKLPIAKLKDPYNFSFSGLKTAVLRLVESEGEQLSIPDAAASIQETVAKTLLSKITLCLKNFNIHTVSIVGGVAANIRLREMLTNYSKDHNINVSIPSPSLCTDNAAMIGIAGSIRLAQDQKNSFNEDVYSSAPLDS